MKVCVGGGPQIAREIIRLCFEECSGVVDGD